MDDSKIVDLYWARSDSAIAETAKKFGAYCRTIAYNVLQNPEDSDECVNDTYMRAWNSMPDKRPSALAPYLGRITRNLALSRVIDKNRLKRGGGEVENRELAAALNRFLAQLPETERALFVSRYWFLAPVAELSKKFGFSESKTASILHRTRGRLRRFLIEEGLA